MTLLTDKVAIVTGASSGIGRAVALLFAAQGAAVMLCARRADVLEDLASRITGAGGQAAAVAGDVCDPDTHDRLFGSASDRFGGLDIAVNNAGIVGAVKPLAELTPGDWQPVLARGGGAIVFTSRFVGTSAGLSGMSAYGAAKAGLMGLTKGIAADYGDQGIRANAQIAGGTDTDLAGNAAQRARVAGLHAMKRIADPAEIANAALFLCSPMAGFVTGSALYADGGNAAVK